MAYEALPAARSPWILSAILVAGVAVYFAIVAWLYAPWLEQAIATEQAPTAWLQSSLLWGCGVIALLLATVQTDRTLGWSVMAAAMVAAALDERFMGHERLQDWFRWTWVTGVDDLANPAAGWAVNAITLAYALAGLGALIWLWRAMTDTVPRRLVLLGFAMGCTAVGMDIWRTDLVWQVAEEFLEAVAETLWLAALLQHAQRSLVRRG